MKKLVLVTAALVATASMAFASPAAALWLDLLWWMRR